MRKRRELRKSGRKTFVKKLQRFMAVLFCVLLFLFLIGVTDMSTRRMIMSKDDKYAVKLQFAEEELLRLDLAGEKYYINIGPALKLKDSVATAAKEYYGEVKDFIKSKMQSKIAK